MGKKRVKLALYIITVVFLGIGIFIRVNFRPKPAYILSANNLVSYYYDLSQRLYQSGKIYSLDELRVAPLTVKENSPPTLALATVWLYRLFHLFFPSVSFLDFSFYLPVDVFAIWAIVGTVIVFEIFKNIWSPVVFLIALTLFKIAINYTRYGMYTEEFLGVFLTFCFFGTYVIWLIKEKKRFWWIGLFLLIMLEATWQQFHFVLFATVFGSLLMKKPAIFWKTILLVLISLLGSQLLVMVVGSNYSAVNMLYEFYYGLKNLGSKDVQTAMSRADWRHFTFKDMVDSFDYIGILMILFAAIKLAISSFNNKAHRIIFAGLFASFLLMAFFIKSRSMFLPFMLLAIGGVMIPIHPKLKKALINIKHWFPLQKKTLLFFLGLVAIVMMAYFLIGKQRPKPEVFVESSFQQVVKGRPIKVSLLLKNIGGPVLTEKDSHGGLHVEVKGAAVTDIQAFSSSNKKGTVVNLNQESGDYRGFETAFTDPDKVGRLELTLMPANDQVSISYRAWLPSSCPIWDRISTMTILRKTYSNWQNSWRSESCIARFPDAQTKDETKTSCHIKVYAGHNNLQDYYCLEKIL